MCIYHSGMEKLMEHRKIDSNGCWLWTASKNRNGYGQIWFDGKMQNVHRLSYKIYVGNPENSVLHKSICKSRACFNPAHLYDGTQKSNINDAIIAGTFIPYGGHNQSIHRKE